MWQEEKKENRKITPASTSSTSSSSSSPMLRRKSEILLAYTRQCVAALVDRELIKTYIENQIEHVWGMADLPLTCSEVVTAA